MIAHIRDNILKTDLVSFYVRGLLQNVDVRPRATDAFVYITEALALSDIIIEGQCSASGFELAGGTSSPVHSHRSLNTNVFTINLYAIGTSVVN